MSVEAMSVAGALVPVTERHVAMLFEAASLWMELGQWENAATTVEGLLALLPRSELAALSRGLLEQAQGRNRKALELFRRAQKLAPTSALVMLHVAEALLLLGHRGEAVHAYHQVLRLDPDASLALLARARIEQVRAASQP